jgi:uncharacterized protein (DUF3820 family)
MSRLTDDSPMPFGKHKGEQMQDVPASYLLWLYDSKLENQLVKNYIEENMEVLQEEDIESTSSKY